MMKRYILIICLSLLMCGICAGCVCTTTPEDKQEWYEYQSGWIRDGYRGNKPWYYYPFFVPAEFIVVWVVYPISTLF